MADKNAEQGGDQTKSQQHTGISNRESPADEAAERSAHPPVDVSSPPPQDAAGRVGEQPLDDIADRHTSHKAGSRSIAQKEADSRYTDRSAPSTHKVDGAFGKEPQDGEPAAGAEDSEPARGERDRANR
jgi:hypothetical protein